MKAVILNEFGSPEALQMTETEKPFPGENQVLIKIKAAGVNPVDTKVRAGTSGISKRLQLPAILGWDVSGIAEACGRGVTGFRPGDEVFGCIGFPGPGGTYAEYTVAGYDQLSLKPRGISFEEAAALPIAGLTAYQSIHDHLKLEAGQTILIQAAAGGVGHLAVQLAGLLKANVIGTASSGNRDFLESLGINRFIDYKREDFETIVKNADAVQDAMGGEVLYRSIACVKPGGRIVCLPSSTKDDPRAVALARDRHVTLMWPMMYPSGQQLNRLASLLEEEKLKIHLSKVFPLPEAAEAHKWIEAHHTVGKVVLRVS